MSYQVLARKWRPQNFDEVVGQENVTRTLKNALELGRVAHAFLFSGARGVGKTSVARILAKALNCVTGPTPTPCNQCQSCVEITQGHSLDVLEIDGASNRGIDEVRELRENIKYLPSRGGYKVFIIDEVHMLTTPAFNALLKTLEEPPAHAIFVMATTDPHKVPVTILSRCQRYDFKRLSTSAIQEHLTRLADQEGWHLSPEGLQLIAQEAEGGMRDAQGLLDQVVTFGGTSVSAAEISRILGVTDRSLLLQTLEATLARQGAKLLEIIAACHDQGHDLRRFYQDLLFFCRHLVIAALGPECRHLTDIADQEWDSLQKLARRTSLAHLFNLLTTLLKGEEELRRSPLPRLSLEILLLKLVSLEPVLDLPDWLARLAKLESRLESPPRTLPDANAFISPPPGTLVREPAPEVKTHYPPPDSPAPSPELPAVDAKRWQSFIKFVEKHGGAPLAGRLHDSRVLTQENGQLTIAPAVNWRLVQTQHLEQFQTLAQQFFGPHCRLEFEPVAAAETPYPPPQSPRPLTLAEIKPLAEEIFGGTWINPSTRSSDSKEDN